jgi:peptide/nickel transport system substrate-binding protein
LGTRKWRRIGGLAAAVLCLVALIELFAYGTWFLSPAGRPPAEPAASSATASPPQPVPSHSVSEWPAERGRDAFKEAPALQERVARGELPPVAERLPENPLVIEPPEQCGPYGGTWTRFATSVGDIGVFQARLAYEGLLRWDAMGTKVLPNLATRWRISEDGRSFTFWLRKGVHWSDGEPFTADDIAFWYEDIVGYEPMTPVPPRELKPGDHLVEFEKLDDFTIRFTFEEPNGLFLKQMASGFSYVMVTYAGHYFRQFHPRHVAEEGLVVQAKADGLNTWRDLWNKQAKYYTNPDMPHLWAWGVSVPPPAQPVVFERNPYYWKVDPEGNQLPYIDQMTFEIYDPELINLKAIEGAIGMQMRHLGLHNYALFKSRQASGGYRVLEWVSGGGGTLNLGINLNHRDPVLRGVIEDRRFRIALSLAINRNEMNEVGYFGLGKPMQNGPPSTSLYYVREYESAYTEYDPDAANRMLDEMGLDQRDKRGVRLRPDDKPIQLFIDTASMVGNMQLLELVAEYWTAVGVKTDVKILARPLFYQRKAGNMHDVGVWWSADEQEPIIDPRWFLPFTIESIQAVEYARWFQTNGKSGEEPHGPLRRCIDIYRQVAQTPDEQEQIRLFKEIIAINCEHLWVIGTVGDVPWPVIVQDVFRNVPDKAIYGWIFRTPGNTAPECYAIDPLTTPADGEGI